MGLENNMGFPKMPTPPMPEENPKRSLMNKTGYAKNKLREAGGVPEKKLTKKGGGGRRLMLDAYMGTPEKKERMRLISERIYLNKDMSPEAILNHYKLFKREFETDNPGESAMGNYLFALNHYDFGQGVKEKFTDALSAEIAEYNKTLGETTDKQDL
jgi:hypothetical protein